jgi:chromosome segregation ATPase
MSMTTETNSAPWSKETIEALAHELYESDDPQDKIDTLEAKIAELEADIDALEDERDELQTKLDEFEAESEPDAEASELEDANFELQSQIDELADEVGRYAGALAGSGLRLTDDDRWAIADCDRAAKTLFVLTEMLAKAMESSSPSSSL